MHGQEIRRWNHIVVEEQEHSSSRRPRPGVAGSARAVSPCLHPSNIQTLGGHGSERKAGAPVVYDDYLEARSTFRLQGQRLQTPAERIWTVRSDPHDGPS